MPNPTLFEGAVDSIEYLNLKGLFSLPDGALSSPELAVKERALLSDPELYTQWKVKRKIKKRRFPAL